ncbi:MAG: hypothetical protein KU38_08575 [Sulfurovum sp. FS08-3]|nr:MAG: hypothetical protein KU38_08575 [Sulfurovum sp. FS08-3]
MRALKQQQLFDEIDILPIDLKTKIIDKILTSISPINKSIDDLWIQEVNQRKNEIESGNVKLVNRDDVFFKNSSKTKKLNEILIPFGC